MSYPYTPANNTGYGIIGIIVFKICSQIHDIFHQSFICPPYEHPSPVVSYIPSYFHEMIPYFLHFSYDTYPPCNLRYELPAMNEYPADRLCDQFLTKTILLAS